MSIFDHMDNPVVIIGIIVLIGAVIYLIYHIYTDISSSNAAEKYKKGIEYNWYEVKPEYDRLYNEYRKNEKAEINRYIKDYFTEETAYAIIDFSEVKIYMGLSKNKNELVFVSVTSSIEHFLNDFTKEIHKPQPHKIEEVNSESIDNILYFKYDENTSYTTSVSGGGANFEGAVKGAVLAGATGAIIGGGARPITSKTEKHTEKAFVIKYTDGKEEKIDYYPEKYYEAYMKVIPKKEYSYVAMKSAKAVSNKASKINVKKNDKKELDDLVKLKELLDKGIITQEEFDAKKKQILDL